MLLSVKDKVVVDVKKAEMTKTNKNWSWFGLYIATILLIIKVRVASSMTEICVIKVYSILKGRVV